MGQTISRQIVGTLGVWDLFHVGHLNFLERARGLGDCLIVGVATDEFVQEYKGEPSIISYWQREKIIKALRCVDIAVPYSSSNATEWLKQLAIDILVVGQDWGKCDGQEEMRDYILKKGKLVRMPYTPGISTSKIRDRTESEY